MRIFLYITLLAIKDLILLSTRRKIEDDNPMGGLVLPFASIL